MNYGNIAELGDINNDCINNLKNLHNKCMKLPAEIQTNIHMAIVHLEKSQEDLDKIIGKGYRLERPSRAE